jgi:peptide chain release factor 1
MDISAPYKRIKEELAQIEQLLADPNVTSDQNRYRELSVRHSELSPAAAMYDEYDAALREVEEAQALLAEAEDDEMREYLKSESEVAAAKAEDLHHRLLLELVPKDPMDQKNAIMEIRAGTGGEEAAIFAGDLYTMYSRYAERTRRKVEVMSANPSEMGGYKEIIFSIEGKGAYGALRHESGVHRVQRVPETEAAGRIHTSAATVAVLPEVEDVDIEINPADLKMETFRAGGPGGQHMQKNETAVRITHVPTGIQAASSDQRSQLQNRENAMKFLRARIYEEQRARREAEQSAARREQVGGGDRSEKIRTYNYPQDRLTDHRIGLTMHNLPSLMVGEIDDLITALQEADQARRLDLAAHG